MIKEIIDGDILDCKEKHIAHQVNALMINRNGHAAGVAAVIFKKFPTSDIYKRNAVDATYLIKLGGVIKRLDLQKKKTIYNIVGQLKPGYPDKLGDDSDIFRLRGFSQALKSIHAEIGEEPIAMPYKIGCGLAGGNWSVYEEIIKRSPLNVVLYRKE